MNARMLVLIAVPVLAFGGQAVAQTTAIDVSYGGWRGDSWATMWSLGYRTPFMRPLDYSLALSHFNDRRSPFDRTSTGAELAVGIARDGSGPYAVAGVGMGMKHYDGNFDTFWSAGLGWAFRALPFMSVNIEGRFRTEDQFNQGFWRLDPTDRRGVAVTAGASLGLGARRRHVRPPPPLSAPTFVPPDAGDVERTTRERGVSKSGSVLAADVVQTALDIMGTPYRWGGDGSNGYDCSGLIQYAYGQHGIILPRVSREQARLGVMVDRLIAKLNPGDILGFSVEGVGVTHVGLYIGDGQFVHSSSHGVKISSLSATDPDSAWWSRRWIVARRVLQ